MHRVKRNTGRGGYEMNASYAVDGTELMLVALPSGDDGDHYIIKLVPSEGSRLGVYSFTLTEAGVRNLSRALQAWLGRLADKKE
jgi:hypothetical protein